MPPDNPPLEIVAPEPAPMRPDALRPLVRLVLRLVLERRRAGNQDCHPPAAAAVDGKENA
jgi:hypothetical protein